MLWIVQVHLHTIFFFNKCPLHDLWLVESIDAELKTQRPTILISWTHDRSRLEMWVRNWNARIWGFRDNSGVTVKWVCAVSKTPLLSSSGLPWKKLTQQAPGSKVCPSFYSLAVCLCTAFVVSGLQRTSTYLSPGIAWKRGRPRRQGDVGVESVVRSLELTVLLLSAHCLLCQFLLHSHDYLAS